MAKKKAPAKKAGKSIWERIKKGAKKAKELEKKSKKATKKKK